MRRTLRSLRNHHRVRRTKPNPAAFGGFASWVRVIIYVAVSAPSSSRVNRERTRPSRGLRVGPPLPQPVPILAPSALSAGEIENLCDAGDGPSRPGNLCEGAADLAAYSSCAGVEIGGLSGFLGSSRRAGGRGRKRGELRQSPDGGEPIQEGVGSTREGGGGTRRPGVMDGKPTLYAVGTTTCQNPGVAEEGGIAAPAGRSAGWASGWSWEP